VVALAMFAIRILSVVPNSASVERLFSWFGIIHSKLRNRLQPEKVRKTAVVFSDTADKFGCPPVPSRKRHFGSQSPAAQSGSSSAMDSLLTVEDVHNSEDTEGIHPADQSFREALNAGTDTSDEKDDDESEDSPEDQDHNPTSRTELLGLSEGILLCNLFEYPSHEMSASRRIFEEFWRNSHEGLRVEEHAQDQSVHADL
jgi:hypothetical protein